VPEPGVLPQPSGGDEVTAPPWDAESAAAWPAEPGAESGVNEARADFAVVRAEEAGQPRSVPAKSRVRLLTGVSRQSRPRVHSGEYRYALLPRLTDRDVEIVRAVWRLNVLTSNQLADMFFSTRGRGLVRLKALYEMGVLDRFQPYREGGGSEPYHYVLGRDGAAMVAAWTGADVDKAVRRYRGNFGTALARRAVLRRSVAVSGFYARLVATQRVNPRCRLRDWLRPEEVANWTQGQIRDAWFGEWQQEGRVEQFFLVPDPGGSVDKLLSDLYRYDDFEKERGEHAHVILVCTSWPRADHAGITQRHADDHGGLVAKDGKPIHNRYRILGPGDDALGVLAQSAVCLSSETSRGWLYRRPTDQVLA